MGLSCQPRIKMLSLLLLSWCSIAIEGWSPNSTPQRLMNSHHHVLASHSDTDKIKTVDVLSLDSIRDTLIRQEETIIFGLIERAQFRMNEVVYKKGGMGDLGVPMGSRGWSDSDDSMMPLSFMEYFLIGTEVLHTGLRRYTSPEEHAFFPNHIPALPITSIPRLVYPPLLSPIKDASSVNFNSVLMKRYLSDIVPSISVRGDDEQHGSTVLADIHVLQALSRRVHYGKFVAESKYQSDPEEYQRLVDAGDADGVMALLTNVAVEEKVLARARIKAATYGREPIIEGATAVRNESKEISDVEQKVCPEVIEEVYRDIIIPLTKVIEVAYLFRRCGRDPPDDYFEENIASDRLRMRRHSR